MVKIFIRGIGRRIRNKRKIMNKYHNIQKRCFSGHTHHSKLEANYCNRLLVMKQAHEIQDYKVQVKFKLANRVNYVADFFVVRFEQGKAIQEVHEVKGVWTAAARIKQKLFEERYPFIPFIVITKKQRRAKWPKRMRGLRILT